MALTSVETFYSPEDENSVIELLEKHADSAMIVAGGTFLHGLVSRGLLAGIEALIDIRKLGLDKVEFGNEFVEIGATTIFRQLQASPDVQNRASLGAIKDAIEYPPVQIMNSATVGGCIASSCPFFDLPVCFLALDSIVKTHGPGGSRDIPMEKFYSGLFDSVLESNEFVTGVKFPVMDDNTRSAFIKMETNANDLAILNVAVRITTDGNNKCAEVRVFIGGGVGEVPVRAVSAEKALQGAVLDDDTFMQAGDAAKGDVDPLSDHRASAEYRTAMTKVLLERALSKALSR